MLTTFRLASAVKFLAAGTRWGLFLALMLSVCAVAKVSGQQPIVVTGAATQIGVLNFTPPGSSSGTGGGWDGSQSPMGGTFAVGPNGDVFVGDSYKAYFFQITPGGTQTEMSSNIGGSTATLDSYGNLYVGGYYNANVFKIPYNAATGAYASWSTTPTANCLGGNQDTAACVFAPAVGTLVTTLTGSGNAIYADIAFDAQGDFFFATGAQQNTQPNTIYECNLACLSNSSATPTLIYADSVPMGAMAIDPWGNIFFIDGANNGASSGMVSYAKEIALVSGTYATTPRVLETYTTTGGYNGLSGLAVSGSGTIFFATNADGIFAMPNTQAGGPNPSGVYMVSTVGGKAIALDAKGNLYLMNYNGGDVISSIPVNHLSLGTKAVGSTTAAVSGTIIDNNASCPTLGVSVTESGVSTNEYSATAGTSASCSAAFGGGNGTFSASPLTAAAFSSYSLSVTFTPTAAGERNAALTISDTANSASGTSQLTGVGQAALANLDPGVETAATTGLNSPAAVAADPAGDLFIADAGAAKVYELANGSSTLTQVGSGFVEPTALAFDAKGNLYIGDNGTPSVSEIPNTSTSGGFTAGTQQTVISSSTLFGGAALASTAGLAFGPGGTLYVADSGNSRVVNFNAANGAASVTQATAANGLKNPVGIALDSSSNLYVADAQNNKIFIFSAAGGMTTVTPPNVTEATGVGVDASGSLVVSDGDTGNIVWIPNVSGTLSPSTAVIIESTSPQASSLFMDPLGNLSIASASGKAAYAIRRGAASINLGSVADGANGTGTVYLLNAGNQAATLASPNVTEPTNTMFTLAPGATNGCAAGTTGNPGQACTFTAEFAPPAGSSDSGAYSGTADVLLSTPSESIPVSISGTASVSAIQPQTITFISPAPPYPSAGYIGQAITLSATATSGLAVSFSTSTPTMCTVSGATATLTAAGTCTIDANQAGGSNNGQVWSAAPQATASITINNVIAVPDKPALLMTETNTYPSIPTGGVLAGPISSGTSIGIGNNGYAAVGETYGGSVAIYNLSTGTVAALGPYSNPGGVTADSSGNLYISAQYKDIIVKLPFVNGAYATLTDPTLTTPPACTGNDTTECLLAPIQKTAAIGGIGAITIDAHGDLFLATDNQGTTQFSIWECTAACILGATGSPAPVMLFQEPAGASPATTGQLYIGSLAVDPWGNLFFNDSNLVNQAISSPDNEATYSDLYELPTSTGTGFGGARTGYAATPAVLQTYTDGTAGGYDDNLDAVAVAANGTIYYATLYDGVFAIPNTQANGPMIASQYAVSGSGAKSMGVDANGNVYTVSSALTEIVLNPLTVPAAQLHGATVTASAAVVDNALSGCPAGNPAALSFTSSNSEFSAAPASGACSAIWVGSGFTTQFSASSYPATISFSATSGGPQTATLAVSDTTNGGVGTATVAGTGQETPQTISFTAPTTTTYTYSPTLSITVTVANGGSNNPVQFGLDSSSTGTGTFSTTTVNGTNSTTTLTVTAAGSIVIDANETGGLVNGVYYESATQQQLTLTIKQASQTISFAPPSSPVTYAPGLTIPLSATGGASNAPVTFNVDASCGGATTCGAGTISTTVVSAGASTATLTVTQAGPMTIDANQAGNTNYAAAGQAQQALVVNPAAQSISFIALTQPFHYIAGGVTLSIQATGGGSDQPIVFNVDPKSTMTGSFSASAVSGATSTTTLTLPAQANTSGTIIVDATQPASANYAAAAQVQETLTILAPLPTQTITFNNPGTQVAGTPLPLTATASSGFPVIYAATPSSVCTVAQSGSTWAATLVASGTCSITASQPGDNQYYAAAPSVTQTFTVNATGLVPAMSLDLSLSTLNIQPGTNGLTQLTVSSTNNFTGQVSFACSGLPSGYTCTFNPNPITVAEGGSSTTTLTVTSAATAALHREPRPFLPAATLAVALCLIGFRRRNRLYLILLAVVSIVGLGLASGCGGSSSPTAQTTSTNVTVTATSGSMQQSTTLTILVE